jgi:hypothetical protein
MIKCNLIILPQSRAGEPYPPAEAELINTGTSSLFINCNRTPFQYIDITLWFGGKQIKSKGRYGDMLWLEPRVITIEMPAGQSLRRKIDIMGNIAFCSLDQNGILHDYGIQDGQYIAQLEFDYNATKCYSKKVIFNYNRGNNSIPIVMR